MKHTEVTNFHYIDFNTNNRVPTQILNTQYGHQKITEQKVALESSNRPLYTDICALLQNTPQVFTIRLESRKYVSRPIILVLFTSILYHSQYSHLLYDLQRWRIIMHKYLNIMNLQTSPLRSRKEMPR